ncbi:MAG TPA: hypothetical protein VF658_01200 [Pyrinomonadaceae bacterium]|jgi:tetratricopeptide (TPR) repeat protein
MQHRLIQSVGICWTLLYAAFIIWIYATEPRNLKEVATKTSVEIGTYQIDQPKFDAALEMFKNKNYAAARDEFERADPERRDFRTQFYIAYSFYRDGCNWLRGDNTLYKQALEAVNRAIALVPAGSNYVVNDEGVDIQLHTPAELKAEIDEGLNVSWGDLWPFGSECK